MKPLVVDASVTAAWCLPDENSEYADDVLKYVSENGMIVPSIWWYEIRNILAVCERRKRLRSSDSNRFLKSLSVLDIHIIKIHGDENVLNLARRGGLSVHDAAYLYVALHGKLKIASLDKKLLKASPHYKIKVF